LLDDSSDLIPFQEYRKGTAYILKIFAFSKDYENIQQAKEKLKGRTDIHVTSSAPWNVEITSPAADKFQMVKRIIDENAISSEEVMVFGDGVNDVCLFREFCHSRAVANAVPQIINMAEKVVADCEENGVAREVAEMFSISL
jgi:hydroxymethylpyrimidine pyrophosphatase-like HAD family hydrolase